MAIEYLKRGKPEADRAEDDAKTAAIVSATLKDIEERGDAAVRELACKFDNYDRDTYRLSHNDIQAIIAKVSRVAREYFPGFSSVKLAKYGANASETWNRKPPATSIKLTERFWYSSAKLDKASLSIPSVGAF